MKPEIFVLLIIGTLELSAVLIIVILAFWGY